MAAECLKCLRLAVRRPILIGFLLLGLSVICILKLLQSGYEKAMVIDKFRSQHDAQQELLIREALNAQVQLKVKDHDVEELTIADQKSQCPIFRFDYFSEDIMKLLDKSNNYACKSQGSLVVKHSSTNVTVQGLSINYVRYREVLSSTSGDDQFSFGEFKWMVQPSLYDTELRKGKTGFIQHVVSKHCLRIEVNSAKEAEHPPLNVVLMFGDKCNGNEAEFSYEESGVLRHVASKMCLEPHHQNKDNPPNDTPLTLGVACKSHFQPALDGLLQHTESKMCFHPLGGGNHPSVGQKLCLYNGCEQEERLKYRWYNAPSKSTSMLTTSASVPGELLEIETQFSDENKQSDFVAQIKETPAAQKKVKKPGRPENVAVIVLDKASAAHVARKLQKSLQELKDMQAFIFQKHAGLSLGDVAENLLGILQGKDATSSGQHPSIFETFSNQGYVTLFSVDRPSTLGMTFPRFQVDHSSNPLGYYAGKKIKVGSGPYCYGSNPIHSICLDYVENFLSSYRSKAKFFVSLLSEITYWNVNGLRFLDDRLQQFLANIKNLKNTVLVITSLRGSLDGQLGQATQGKIEARLPFLAIYVSPDIKERFSGVAQNLDKLTTPHDIYETLFALAESGLSAPSTSSLLGKLEERDCARARLTKRICPCVKVT